jgi:putative membrane protein
MKHLVKIVVIALALIIAANVVKGITVEGFGTALIVALVLGLINLLIRPVLGFLTLPITILTFGIFAFVLNALLFWFSALLVPNFSVSGFLPALLGSLIISAAHYLTDWILS